MVGSCLLVFAGGSDGKESAYNVGGLGSVPVLGRNPGGGHGGPVFLPGESPEEPGRLPAMVSQRVVKDGMTRHNPARRPVVSVCRFY